MVQNLLDVASHGIINMEGGDRVLSTSKSVVNENYFRWKFIGFRFVPTDVELIQDYLMKKVKGEPLPPNPNFHETNIYDTNPDQLSREYKQSDGGTEWYFFSSRNKKYPKGWRPNRETGNRIGFWKVTGVTKPVTLLGRIIGYKSNLDFYLRQDPDNKKTEWKMHEYQVEDGKTRSSSQGMMLDKWVLCKIYLTRTKKGTGTEKESEEEDHCPDVCSSPQDANGPPSTARNSDMVDATTSMATPFSIQNPDVSFSRQDYRGMYAMKASNYNEGAMNLAPQSSWNITPTYVSYNQYSNASFSQLPPDGACLMPDSSEKGVAGSSSMAGNNNIMHASHNHFMAGYSQQVVNGASPMAGSYVQGMNEAPLMPGINNTMYAPMPAYPIPDPMVGSYQQAINGAPLMAGESNTVSASQNPLMEVVTAFTTPNAYGQVLNGAPSMAMGSSVQNSLQKTEQAVNFIAGNIDTSPAYALAPEYQNPNDCPFQNDFHGAFSMDGFNENHCSSWDPYPEPLPENFNGNNNFLKVKHPNATSFGPTVDDRAMNNEGSLIAAGNNSNNSNAMLEGCNSVATHPDANVQQPNATSSLPTVSDKSGNEKGSAKAAGRNSNPLATQPEDGNEEEEEEENSGSATQPTVGQKFEDLDCYMDLSFFD
ncbi:hypothetical protein V6N13_085635 [Hibiscus sabdariffa]|uniref:NAC domain-containing protein n=1 Tax=Hibiscus sabdariffa TaxID=183260 RepID=A0ABR2D258_9ROSI